MRKAFIIALLICLIDALISCRTKEPDRIGAAGKAEEMADSTRLDSSVEARKRGGEEPRSTDDTL